ncbi:selenoprotein T-like [Tropilaelaps mercedesae]|uniref:Selenoprotein T-like n=1 Tax=Tropilaelaps mercedesae TaxID=418985 RepID=A0A1V9XYC2_9ACAR|nr:selenoprotein T-like [Tropilaelaps mercedesae]
MAEGGGVLAATVFGIFLAFSVYDFMSPGGDSQDESGASITTGKSIPKLKMDLAGSPEIPQLTFLYCTCINCMIGSCVVVGYKGAFQQYAEILQRRYPEMRIVGDTFTPPFPRMLIAQALGVTKLLVMALFMISADPFRHLNTPTPAIWTWLLNNKIYGCLLTFFLTGMVETQLISTGAFEIYLNQEQLWSKLGSGRIPDPTELFNLIDARRSILFGGKFENMAELRETL